VDRNTLGVCDACPDVLRASRAATVVLAVEGRAVTVLRVIPLRREELVMNTGSVREDPRVTVRGVVLRADVLDPGVRTTARGCGDEIVERATELLDVRLFDEAELGRTTRIGVERCSVVELLLRADEAMDGVVDRELRVVRGRVIVRGLDTVRDEVRGAVIRDREDVREERDESELRLEVLRRNVLRGATEREEVRPRLTLRGETERELREVMLRLEGRLTRELIDRLELRGLDRAHVSVGSGSKKAITIRATYHRIVLDRNMATAFVLSGGSAWLT